MKEGKKNISKKARNMLNGNKYPIKEKYEQGGVWIEVQWQHDSPWSESANPNGRVQDGQKEKEPQKLKHLRNCLGSGLMDDMCLNMYWALLAPKDSASSQALSTTTQAGTLRLASSIHHLAYQNRKLNTASAKTQGCWKQHLQGCDPLCGLTR